MKHQDYYKILGVERSAPDDEIKKAYRKLARKLHPDVSKEHDAEARFKEMREAYETLKDPEKRAAYDHPERHFRSAGRQPPPGQTGGAGGAQPHFDDLGDLADLFAQMGGAARGAPGGAGRFGGATHAGHGDPVHLSFPGADLEAGVKISLEDAASGTEVDLQLAVPQLHADGSMQRDTSTIRVKIPPGAAEGQRLRLRGKGGPGFNGGAPGDLYLGIHLLPHPLFRVSGHDLFIDLPLTPAEAALGTAVELPTLGGRVRVTVKPCTSSGTKMRLTGKGLPRPTGLAGDLFAVVQVMLPPHLTDAEKSLYQSLAAAAHADPRAHFNQKESA